MSQEELPSAESTDPLFSLAVKLVSLVNLRRDWDTYGAEPPSETSLRRAFVSMLRAAPILRPENVLPSVEGGVTIVYSTNARGYAAIEFDNDGDTIAALKPASGPPKVWEVDDEAGIVAAVKEFRRFLGRRV